MKILAFTDIHGSYRAVEQTLERERAFDAIIIGGDLTTHGSPGEAEEAIRQFQKFEKPLLVVAGNMDPPELEGIFETLGVSINATGRILGELGFFGVSASPFTPMHTPYEISEEEIAHRAESGWKDVQSARIKIFVPHAPPRDTNVDKLSAGTHVGSTSVRSFIDRRQPDVAVCGHIHEARGQDTMGKTKVVNCGAAGRGYYVVITVGDNAVIIENRG